MPPARPKRPPLTPSERGAFLAHLTVYLAAMYPGCPFGWRLKLVERARERRFFGRVGEAAGILADTFIRHEKTSYDRLRGANGKNRLMSRDDARKAVSKEVEETIGRWRQGSPENDPVYRAMMDGCRVWRNAQGLRKNHPAVISHENGFIAGWLEGWLEGRRAGPQNELMPRRPAAPEEAPQTSPIEAR